MTNASRLKMSYISRLQHEKPTFYSKNILVGNWFEEKVGSYKKNRFKHNSVYRQDFTESNFEDKRSNDDLRNDTKIKSEYTNRISTPATTDDGPNYYDNFSTIYDLSYQYFPQWIHGTLDRKIRFRLLKHEPLEEYLNGFGNLSSRNGLTQHKKEKWECDILDPRSTVTSTARSDFIKYDNDLYKQSRWPRLTPKKIKCGSVIETVYKQLPSKHPRTIESKCNPITWECEKENTLQEKCVCKIQNHK